MRPAFALAFALLLAALALAQATTLKIEHDAEASIVDLDTRLPAAFLRFHVTNLGAGQDYVTIPRQDIRWKSTGMTSLGVPTPEFGLALAPGASGDMAVRVDFQEPRVQQDSILLPFKSEATGQTTTVEVPLQMKAAPASSSRILVEVVDAGGGPVGNAQVVVTDIIHPQTGRAAPTRDPSGRFIAQVAPGEYAVRADAAGKLGATMRVEVAAGAERNVRLTLGGAPAAVQADPIGGLTVDDSIWLLAASDDLRTLATAPMTHQQESEGRFHAIVDGEREWTASFPRPGPGKANAGPFQALDTFATVSRDGARIAGFDWSGRLHVYDAATARELWSDDRANDTNPLYPANSAFGKGFFTSGAASFSPDRKQIVAGGSSGWVVAFDADTGVARWTLATGGEVRAVRHAADGKSVFVGSGDWLFRRVDAQTGEVEWASKNEFWPFFFIALSQDGTRVASGGKDATLRVWDAATGRELLAEEAWPGFVTGAGVGSDHAIFSDWSYGVRSVALDGTLRWFRAFSTSNVATTPDAKYALVGWWDPAAQRAGLALLDGATGTTLWEGSPDVARTCTTTISPFPAKQLRSVHLAYANDTTLRAAASCIGGGVFTTTLRVSAAPVTPTQPVTTTTITTSPVTTTQASGTTTTTLATTQPTPPPNPTPAPGVALVVASLSLLALGLRKRQRL